jgi:hypothetical protein
LVQANIERTYLEAIAGFSEKMLSSGGNSQAGRGTNPVINVPIVKKR